MLLSQPFDPFKEQKRKPSFFAKCHLFSRTRRALSELKNRKRMMISNQYYAPPPPLPLAPQPWFGYDGCYEPWFSQPMFMPPPPPPPPMYPVHFCGCCMYQGTNNSSGFEDHATLYSSNSSQYSVNDGKELEIHPLEQSKQISRRNSVPAHRSSHPRPASLYRNNSSSTSCNYPTF